MWLNLSFRLFKQELKRGELTIIALAISLAVIAVVALSGVSERIQGAILTKSASFIAADRLIQTAYPIPDEWFNDAPLKKIQQSQHVSFTSMLFANDNPMLASIKAVKQGYPLRGELLLYDSEIKEIVAPGIPPTGEVWVASRVLHHLNLQIGDRVEIGSAEFIISATIAEEPDRSFNVFATAPRVLMNWVDIDKTEVIHPASRLTYRYLFAGDTQAIKVLGEWIKPKLSPTQRWLGIKDRESPIADSLNKAEQFLMLSGLLGIILATVAISVAAQRYSQRHYDFVAIGKTLGASKITLIKIYWLHLSIVTISCILFGLVIGTAVQQFALSLLAPYLPSYIPPLSIQPWLMATFTGLVCSFVFSLVPFINLLNIPPLRVLQRQLTIIFVNGKQHFLLILITLYGLMLLYSQHFLLASLIFLGSLVLVITMLIIGQFLIHRGRKLGFKIINPFHLAFANIQRRGTSSSIQLVSFSLAIMMLLILYSLRSELLQSWQDQLPQDTPNYFLVNIAHHEAKTVESFLQSHQTNLGQMYPVTLGRLTTINDEVIRQEVSKEEEDQSDRGGRQGIGRELNLSWLSQPPKHNQITSGQWFSPQAIAEVSIESGVAKRLEIKLGDRLVFLIGGISKEVTVTSIREVNWSSLQPNFFMLFSPDVLQGFPTTYMTAFKLNDPQSAQIISQFARQFPTVSIIDVDQFITQIRSVINQITAALQFVLIVVIGAGILVLWSQIQAATEERQQEVAIYRTLGAASRLVQQTVFIEFLLLGAIAGFIATLITEITLWLLYEYIFKLEPSLHYSLWLLGPVIGGFFIAVIGWLLTRSQLKMSPADLVRTSFS